MTLLFGGVRAVATHFLLARSARACLRSPLRAVQAQTPAWPQRPVRVIVPFAAGGNIDVMARLTCQRMSEVFGQQFVVENRVGGNGTIAAESVAHAQPDGYTLFWAGPAVVSIFPAITKATYDPVKDFKPISVIGVNPQVLVVNAKLPIAGRCRVHRLREDAAATASLCGRRRPGQPEQSADGAVPQARRPRDDQRELPRHRSGHDRSGGRPYPDHVRAVVGSAAAGRGRQHPHARRLERQARPPGPERADHRGIRISRLSRARAGTASWRRPPRPTPSWSGSPPSSPAPPRIRNSSTRLDQEGVDPLGSSPAETARFIAADMALWADAVKIAGVSLQ